MVLDRHIPEGELAYFFEDLAELLSAGISLIPALGVLASAAGAGLLRTGCTQISEALAQGMSLAQAMADSGFFPGEAVRAIQAAEKAGELPRVAIEMAGYYRSRADIRRRILEAIAYPCIVVVIMIAVFVYMSVEVVPRLQAFLPAQAMNDPLTKAVISAGMFVRHYGLIVGLVMLAGVGIAGTWLRRDPQRAARLFADVPLLGPLARDQELADSFFILALMLKSGVPLDMAMSEAVLVSSGAAAERLEACRIRIKEGAMISVTFRQDRYFPAFVAETLAIGEVSGRFSEYFLRVHHLCRRAVTSRTERLLGLLPPVLTLTCGAMVALLVLAFLRPLYANLSGVGGMPM